MLDVDFGASPILASRADGGEVLLAGQKSGMLWALDPDTRQAAVESRVRQGLAAGRHPLGHGGR